MIRNRLKEIVASRDLSLNQLANNAGIHYTTLFRFAKQGNTQIHMPTLEKICKSLEIQPGDIFIFVSED